MYELASIRRITYNGYKASIDPSGNLRLQWKIWVFVGPQGIFEETIEKSNSWLLLEVLTLQGIHSDLKSQCAYFLQEDVSLDDQVMKALTFVVTERSIFSFKEFRCYCCWYSIIYCI